MSPYKKLWVICSYHKYIYPQTFKTILFSVLVLLHMLRTVEKTSFTLKSGEILIGVNTPSIHKPALMYKHSEMVLTCFGVNSWWKANSLVLLSVDVCICDVLESGLDIPDVAHSVKQNIWIKKCVMFDPIYNTLCIMEKVDIFQSQHLANVRTPKLYRDTWTGV